MGSWKLCVLQCTDEEIASWVGVSSLTIERRRKRPEIRDIMERGKAKGRVSLRRSLWRLANAGNPAANIFLGKNLLGYRDVLKAGSLEDDVRGTSCLVGYSRDRRVA